MAARTGGVYQAFALHWRSDDLELPELPRAPMRGIPDVEPSILIEPEAPERWPELPPGRYDTPFMRMAQGDLRLNVEGIGRFRISGGQHIAWWKENPAVSDQDLRTFLLGSAVGALLIQRGGLVLHGCALERDDGAIVCLGHSGAGKSTLAYALMRQGWRLLADDLVAVSPQAEVLPGIPRIKLWHDAATAFGLDPKDLPPVRQGMQKGLLFGEAVRRCDRAVPLRALYLIHHRDPRLSGATPPISRIASQKEAALLLRNQAFRPRFIRGLGQEGRMFLGLATLQQQVPLASLRLPPRIEAMCAWLERQDLLQSTAPAVEQVGLQMEPA